jgi:hypothetical protein
MDAHSGVVTLNPLTWVTARDGSAHATRPPILAAGHTTLCGLAYGRRDLRIREQAAPGEAPANSCRTCREAVAQAFADATAETEAAHERKAPLWP